MLHSLIDLLSANHLLLLFFVIGIGYLIGNIRIFGFSLGVAAVLFAGIGFGALDSRLALPEEIHVIGLVFFVYAIGLQAGPTFFASLNRKGLRMNLFVVGALAAAAGVSFVISRVFSISSPYAAGMFCGSLTNTPALAAAIESVKSASAALPRETQSVLANAPVVAYGMTYPFGVLGVLLWMYVLARVLRIDFRREEEQRKKESGSGALQARTLRVINPAMEGKTLAEVMGLIPHSGFVLSRIRKGEKTRIIAPDTILGRDDVVVAVGTEESLERARVLFGEFAGIDLPKEEEGFEYRRIFVSNSEIVGKNIHQLNLEKDFGATITRLRRGDVDFVPDPGTVLELGDRVRVVTSHDNMQRITEFFGDSMKAISETDFLSLSLGIVLGVVVGMFPVPLPNGSTFKLGFAGGPLVVSLILGRLQRTGSVTWVLPFNANLVLRQVGLVLFLAGIGIKAGFGFGSTLMESGWRYLAAGSVITTTASLLTLLLGYLVLKLPMSAVLGLVSGASTQPACLAFANQLAQNDQPNVHYATVYPAAMVAKIILAQILVTALWP